MKDKKVIELPGLNDWRDLTLGELQGYMRSDPRALFELRSYKKKGEILQEAIIHFTGCDKCGPMEEVMVTANRMVRKGQEPKRLKRAG